MPFIQARAKFTDGANGRIDIEDSPILNVNIGGVSTLELREGTFTTLSGGTLTFANGSSTTFTPGIATTYNVTTAQAGVANFRGTSPNYTVRGSSLVKVLKYPDNATIINHEDSRNLIQVPQILPPNVTVLLAAFGGCSSFNQSLNDWDVSKVTTMSHMFKDCINFNQPLGNWNTSNVTDMKYMFYGCTNFNQNISGWNTSKVTNMNNMFYGCSSFNQLLMFWDVSNVTNMSSMFSGCSSFDQFLASWNTSNVTDMSNMFRDCTNFNQNISGWNTSKVTNMSSMFNGCSSFNLPLNSWNVSNVTNMDYMFARCTKFNQTLHDWNVGNVTDMRSMFHSCSVFDQDINSWNVFKVTDMIEMFYGCSNFNKPLNNWNVRNVTVMYGMFSICTNFNQPLNNWNTGKVTTMHSMFMSCTKFNQDLSSWCVPLIASKPNGFNDNAPNLTANKLPVWGTCPNPSLTSTASWYRDANLTSPVGYSTNLRDTYCVFDLKNVKGGEVLELTGHPYTLTVYTIDVTLLSDSSKLTSPIGFNTLYALYKSPDRGNIPMRTIPITIPKGITGNVRLVFKSSAFTLHHSLDRGSSVFDFILKHNNVQIGVIKTAYSS